MGLTSPPPPVWTMLKKTDDLAQRSVPNPPTYFVAHLGRNMTKVLLPANKVIIIFHTARQGVKPNLAVPELWKQLLLLPFVRSLSKCWIWTTNNWMASFKPVTHKHPNVHADIFQEAWVQCWPLRWLNKWPPPHQHPQLHQLETQVDNDWWGWCWWLWWWWR